MQFTQKEMTLLKDLKSQEQLCVDKYTKYASWANDSELKKLFSAISTVEQNHLDTITQFENGGSSTSSSSAPSVPTSFTANYGVAETPEKKADCFLCSDLLADEKHVSSVYNTSIFEFKDQSVRDKLNHIQKEEQEHGKAIYDYMTTNSMYS